MKDYIYSRKAYRIQKAVKERFGYEYQLPNDNHVATGYLEGYMPFSLYDEMVSEVVKRFGVHSVFSISKLTQVSDSGLIGQLIVNSEKIIDAMNAYAEYSELLGDVAKYEFYGEDSYYEMRLFFKENYESSEFIFHKILLDTYNIFTSISETEVDFHDFYLSVGIRNEYVEEGLLKFEYGKIIQPKADFYYARVARKYMDTPVFQPCLELAPSINEILKQRALEIKRSTNAARIESIIFFSEQPSRVNIEMASEILSLSRAQLQRRLFSEGFKFQEIKNSVLKKRVAFLALTQGKSLREISIILGYSNPSALSRSFKSWYGVSFEYYIKALNRKDVGEL